MYSAIYVMHDATPVGGVPSEGAAPMRHGTCRSVGGGQHVITAKISPKDAGAPGHEDSPEMWPPKSTRSRDQGVTRVFDSLSLSSDFPG